MSHVFTNMQFNVNGYLIVKVRLNVLLGRNTQFSSKESAIQDKVPNMHRYSR